MTTFLSVCLCAFAFCAFLGMLITLILAAKAGQRAAALGAVLIAVFVIAVLVTAAGDLR